MELCREGGLGLPGAGTGRRSYGGEGEGQEEEGRRGEEKGRRGRKGEEWREVFGRLHNFLAMLMSRI